MKSFAAVAQGVHYQSFSFSSCLLFAFVKASSFSIHLHRTTVDYIRRDFGLTLVFSCTYTFGSDILAHSGYAVNKKATWAYNAVYRWAHSYVSLAIIFVPNAVWMDTSNSCLWMTPFSLLTQSLPTMSTWLRWRMTDNASTGLEFSSTLIYTEWIRCQHCNQRLDIARLPWPNHCLHIRLLRSQRRHIQTICSWAHHRNPSPLLQVESCTSSSHVSHQHKHTLTARLCETIMKRISKPLRASIRWYLRHITRSVYPCIPIDFPFSKHPFPVPSVSSNLHQER